MAHGLSRILTLVRILLLDQSTPEFDLNVCFADGHLMVPLRSLNIFELLMAVLHVFHLVPLRLVDEHEFAARVTPRCTKLGAHEGLEDRHANVQ